ncbi:MAG: undecaprenyl/decaprenyl-phosphate alpha-N-acetylglucosaminyl 1-phosphate transferase [Sedimentisphaerales bacterium]|nr:undecaprenyl/decaprenyl-phosphate alpha-N-acetylglucosaminyl 1-phosphate transferase [Sedimentisphaerales bacterium]
MISHFLGPERPISWVMQFWPVLVCSFAFALVATALCKKIALRYGIVDRPDHQVKTHKETVAYLGGVGILVGVIAGILAGLYCFRGREHLPSTFLWLFGVWAGGAVACFVGLVDDLFDLKPYQKMFGQVVAAMILVAVGIRPSFSFLQAYLGWNVSQNVEIILGVPVVILFVLGATNSLNLLDGLDGLCAGVTVIITLALLLLAIHLGTWASSNVGGDSVRVIVCLGLLGAVCGFLPFNRHPAKIFMGDAGSMLLGFFVAALMILFAEKAVRWWMASVVVFGLPILDTVVALIRRLMNHRPLFVSDRGHIYDQMIDRGIPLKKTVALCYALAALYALIGLALSLRTQIRARYALIIYVLVFALSGLIVWKKGYLKMDGLRGAIHKK